MLLAIYPQRDSLLERVLEKNIIIIILAQLDLDDVSLTRFSYGVGIEL